MCTQTRMNRLRCRFGDMDSGGPEEPLIRCGSQMGQFRGDFFRPSVHYREYLACGQYFQRCSLGDNNRAAFDRQFCGNLLQRIDIANTNVIRIRYVIRNFLSATAVVQVMQSVVWVSCQCVSRWLLRPGRAAEYCGEHVCATVALSVDPSVREHISETAHP